MTTQNTEDSISKKNRIKSSILDAEFIDLGTIDLEGVYFSDIEIGDIISQKLFSDNPYAQLILYIKYNELDKKKDRIGLSDDEEQKYFEYYARL
jgi:hypothetical protein